MIHEAMIDRSSLPDTIRAGFEAPWAYTARDSDACPAFTITKAQSKPAHQHVSIISA